MNTLAETKKHCKRNVIMVVGATGSLGLPLVKELQQRSSSVRLFGRSAESFEQAGLLPCPPGVEVVVCTDVTDRSAFPDQWFADVYCVLCVARARSLKEGDNIAFEAMMHNLFDAVCDNEVPTFLMVGLPFISEYTIGLTPTMTSVRQMESKAKERFSQTSKSNLIVARISEMSEFGHLLEIAQKIRLWLCLRGCNPRVHPISAHDFAVALATRYTTNHAPPQEPYSELLIGGPKSYTWRELGGIMSDVTGKEIRVLTVPFWLICFPIKVLRLLKKLWPAFEGIENVLTVVITPMSADSTSNNHEYVGSDCVEGFLSDLNSKGGATYVHKRVSRSWKSEKKTSAIGLTDKK